MLKKINKKILFRTSVIVSSVLAFFAGNTAKDTTQKFVTALDVPIFSIEKAYASDGGGCGAGGCCGSSDGGITFPAEPPVTYPPAETVSGLGIRFSVPTTDTYTCGGCGGCGGCFVAGTSISLADGSAKNIEEISTDDAVATSAGEQPVMRIYNIPYTGEIYAFNGSDNYFVSPSHPFMTTAGWKSIDPAETAKETPDLAVGKLEIGDEIVRQDGTTFTVTDLTSRPFETTLYNFDVNGSHDYFADGFLVHNVSMKLINKAEAASESNLK